MKNISIYATRIAYCIMLTLMVGSCSKSLDVALPNDQISDQTLFTTKPTILSAMNGMYSAFANQSNIATRMRSLYWLSDEGEISPAPGTEIGDMITANLVATNQWFPSWSWFYTPIYRANQLIEALPNVPLTVITETEKKQYIAAAKYVRAVNHFMLVTSWGDIPLVMNTSVDINKSITRTPVSTVYDAIIKDLREAANDLPATVNVSNSRTIHNRFQAMAFLARVYLYQGSWSDAETAATEVINSGQYQIVTGVNNVFRRGSREAILSLAETATSASFLNRTAIGWNTLPANAGNTNTLNCAIPVSLLATFQSGDQRAVEGNWVVTLFGKKFANKYLYSLNATTAQAAANPQDYVLQRYAELFLIRAEARAQQSNLAGAVSDINVIRNRAGLTNFISSSQPAILTAIERERVCELFYEGHRWYDLKRTGRLNTVLSAVPYKAANYKSYYDLWPVAPRELLANPALTQNPGY
ncbi:MAG: RagB/SusD family nutrient uptake outer membrane protein [Chitinophagales bacterium]|nr:RagB/SusD family nutrient uptake outer membrane protein [Chitinophagales bacterium]